MTLCVTALALASTACYPSIGGWDEDWEDVDEDAVLPVASASAVIHLDATRERLVVVRPNAQAEVDVRVHELGDPQSPSDLEVYALRAKLDGSGVLALTTTRDGEDGSVRSVLHHLGDAADSTPESVVLPAAYPSLRLTPDHRRALLFFGDDDAPVTQGLHNANQFSVIDLSSGSLSPRTATVDGFGGRVRDVHFPGQVEGGVPMPVDVGGVLRDIAVFLADGEIVLHDLDHPEDDRVALALPSNRDFLPDQTLLRAGDEAFASPVLFVRSRQSADLAMLNLVDKSEPGGSGFSVVVSLLSVGNGVSDMLAVNDGGRAYLVALRDETLVFADIATQQSHSLDLGWSAHRMVTRTAEDGSSEAILWGSGGQSVLIVPLTDIQNASPRRIREFRIQGGIGEFVRLGSDRAMVSSRDNLYILDFAGDGSVTPLATSIDEYHSEDAMFVGDLLHLAPKGYDTIHTVDLDSLAPSSLVLGSSTRASFAFPDIGKFVVLHPDRTGYVSVVDAAQPRRATTRSRWGYLIEGALDAKHPASRREQG